MPPVVQVITHGDINEVHVVDLRSDTVSKPTPAMRKAMAVAEVGDDVMGEDPTVQKLEAKAAGILGKEAAVFVPSGTMANLIAIMVHCNQRGSEFIAGHTSHIFLFEQGGSAALAGAQCALVANKNDGTFCLDEVRERIRVGPDFHETFTSLITIENTHNMCGGQVLPLTWLDELAQLANSHNIPIHMDGARLMNAVVQSKVPASRIVRDMASVCFCLSKGLGCPIGSLLCGTKTFITKARRTRKMLGGGLRQCGIIAAAGLIALEQMVERLQIDHEHMYTIAKAIDDLDSDLIRVDLKMVKTNIAMVRLDRTRVTADAFLKRLATVKDTDSVKVIVKGSYRNDGCIRLVLHWEVTDDDVNKAIEKILLVAHEFNNSTLKILV
ncbi:hypothetical protein RN001_010698 [Aquatica leii]|uniref:Aromatic amino acid beta-eliminating lyase/threonine aldolase domain-containing protein n=1 Tax=Aquatica leii TaxID=1421715 RepID=A0AAN7SEL7_9COLE|nr:hypothetical protein RN001_010698 [Aquatica leii]